MGFLQYVGPTLQFLVAVCLFHEPLNRAKLGSFALCWLAILVYVADSLLNRRAQPVGGARAGRGRRGDDFARDTP